MKSVYIVTSVIKSACSSCIDSVTRIEQTKRTIHTIRQRDPSASIILCEGSDFDWGITEQDEDVYYISCIPNVIGYHKSKGEALIIKYTLESEVFRNLNADRIYKLSGRYELTDDFNHKIHEDTDKIVVRQYPSHIPDRFVTLTVLFSFPKKYVSFLYERMQYVLDYHDTPFERNGTEDIEHLIFGDTLDERFLTLQVMGAKGIVSTTHQTWSG